MKMNEKIRQAYIGLRSGVFGPLLPHPAPKPEIAAYLVLGRKPKELAPQLTRREANEWVRQNVHATPEEWLWTRMRAEYIELRDAKCPGTMEVIRWCAKVLDNPATRASSIREDIVLMGDDTEGSVWDRIDEVQPCDLCRSPWGTIANASSRQIREMWSGPDELQKYEPWMDSLPEGAELIRHFSRLFQEGKEMRHCVASYAQDIAYGHSMIFSLRTNRGRSTAEYRNGQLIQHKAARNEQPTQSCIDLANEVAAYLRSLDM